MVGMISPAAINANKTGGILILSLGIGSDAPTIPKASNTRIACQYVIHALDSVSIVFLFDEQR